ncbi:MAG: class I SAM-dependent methyltransferase [Alphaproteobacteria bacterium]|nr:class I SAM-dependent methyltransferase [Alphaproteobacteria bacterium]
MMDPSAPIPLRAPMDRTSATSGLHSVIAAAAPPGALDAPAARRNAIALLRVLETELPATGTVVEIGAGTGQHAAAFAPAMHPRHWLPTETDPERLDSIAAWAALLPAESPRPLPGRRLDAAAPAETWPLEDISSLAGFVSANVIHIAPWSVGYGILAGAARWLPPGAPLILYGPFHRDGRHTSPGNSRFDAELRAQNPQWGIRDLEREIVPAAGAAGLSIAAIHEMPANNLSVVLRR